MNRLPLRLMMNSFSLLFLLCQRHAFGRYRRKHCRQGGNPRLFTVLALAGSGGLLDRSLTHIGHLGGHVLGEVWGRRHDLKLYVLCCDEYE